MARPLDGLRVLDLTRLLPGPFCAWILASMGADVVKVEDTGAGDYARLLPPMVGRHGGLFHVVNRGARSIAVDLKTGEGREVLLRLVDGADVLLDGFRPGVLASLGVGPDVLRARNPRLVGCSITGYGQDGPLSRRAGHDIGYIARAGVLGMSGPGDRPPPPPPLPIADLAGGALPAALGVLGALLGRERTGRGDWIDVSMMECAAALAAPIVAMGGGGARGSGPLTGGLAFYRCYACADGRHVAVGALEPRFHTRLSASLGHPEWSDAPPVPGPEQERVAAEMAALFLTQPREHWIALLGPLDACVEPVLDPDEACAPGGALHARGRVEAGHGVSWARWPLGAPVEGDAPDHGQHTDELLRALGFLPDGIADLRARGVVS